MGSIFRVDGYENINLDAFLGKIKKNALHVYAADTQGHDISKFESPAVLIIGSESDGVSPNLYPYCDHRVKIARYGRAESLNAAVACGILLNEFAKQIQNK